MIDNRLIGETCVYVTFHKPMGLPAGNGYLWAWAKILPANG